MRTQNTAVINLKPKDIVLFLNNEQMRVYCWIGDEFKIIGTFVESEIGLGNFLDCILAFGNTPITLIIDHVGEYFRHETIAHVSKLDRKAMLNRKLQHYFNSSQFRSAKVVGSEKNSRKEDKVLFMALTNTDLFLPWINKLIDKKLQIKSITSVTFLMESLCRYENLKDKPFLLIVNVEPDGSFRQSYLEKGTALFSRTNPLLSDCKERAGVSIENQCTQFRTYLERVNLLPRDSLLEIYIYSPYEKSSTFDLTPYNNERVHYTQKVISAMAKKYEVPYDAEHTGIAEIALGHAFHKEKGLNNIYSPKSFLRYFTINDIVNKMQKASYAVVAITFLFLLQIVWSSFKDYRMEERLSNEINSLQGEYELARQSLKNTPIEPVKMQLIVDHYENIFSQLDSPKNLMALMSQAVTENPEVDVSSFTWEIISNSDEELITSLVNNSTEIISTIKGSVELNGNYQYAQSQVKNLIVSLESLPGVAVVPVLMPMDTSADSQVAVTLNDEFRRTEFILQLTYEPVI